MLAATPAVGPAAAARAPLIAAAAMRRRAGPRAPWLPLAFVSPLGMLPLLLAAPPLRRAPPLLAAVGGGTAPPLRALLRLLLLRGWLTTLLAPHPGRRQAAGSPTGAGRGREGRWQTRRWWNGVWMVHTARRQAQTLPAAPLGPHLRLVATRMGRLFPRKPCQRMPPLAITSFFPHDAASGLEVQLGGSAVLARPVPQGSGLPGARRDHFAAASGEREHWMPAQPQNTMPPPLPPPLPARCRQPLPPLLPPSCPQGTIGLQLHSTARVCELYSVAPGGEASYVSTCRGAQLPGQQLWVLEHTWPQAWLVPPVVRLRLFSLLDRDELQMTNLQLLPAAELQAGAAATAAAPASNGAAASGADWEALWDASSGVPAAVQPSPTAAAAAASQVTSPAAAGARGAAHAAPPAAGPTAAAAGGSQLDEVRQMLSRLATEEASSSGSAAADPKRALMVSLANAVLRQPAAPPTSLQQQQAAPLMDEWRQQQKQQQQQQQQMGEALGRLEQQEERRQQQLDQALARLEQQQERQQQQVAGALSRLEQQQERQQRQVAEALGRLEQRVAAVESLCHEMHAMLRQLVAQQHRTKQPMRAGVSGLGIM